MSTSCVSNDYAFNVKTGWTECRACGARMVYAGNGSYEHPQQCPHGFWKGEECAECGGTVS
jgi:hypothetical protein